MAILQSSAPLSTMNNWKNKVEKQLQYGMKAPQVLVQNLKKDNRWGLATGRAKAGILESLARYAIYRRGQWYQGGIPFCRNSNEQPAA